MQTSTDEEVFRTFGSHIETCLGESLPKASHPTPWHVITYQKTSSAVCCLVRPKMQASVLPGKIQRSLSRDEVPFFPRSEEHGGLESASGSMILIWVMKTMTWQLWFVIATIATSHNLRVVVVAGANHNHAGNHPSQGISCLLGEMPAHRRSCQRGAALGASTGRLEALTNCRPLPVVCVCVHAWTRRQLTQACLG